MKNKDEMNKTVSEINKTRELEIEKEVINKILIGNLLDAIVKVGTAARFSSRFEYLNSISEKLETIEGQIDEILSEVNQ